MDELTDMVDDSVDFATFMDASEEGMKREHEECVNHVRHNRPAQALPLAGNKGMCLNKKVLCSSIMLCTYSLRSHKGCLYPCCQEIKLLANKIIVCRMIVS